MKIIVLLLTACVGVTSFGRNLTNQEKESDFVQLNQLIETNYGPYLYKQQRLGLKYSELREKYKQEVLSTKTNAEFYYALTRYVSEFHDGHFAATLPTDYKAEIPIMTDLIDGKVLITDINRVKLSEKLFPFSVGDEILSLNGVSIELVLNDLSQYLGSGFQLTEKRTAAQVVFIRPARRLPVPQGDVEVEIRRGTSSVIEKVVLKWTVTGTPFDENILVQRRPFIASSAVTDYDRLSAREMTYDLLGSERIERSYRCSGGTRIDIPKDATVIMKEPFVAYYHPTEKGQVGYLRIPHYSFPNPENTFKQYEYAIHVLEQNTVGLIIDQDHNCGGSVDFLHSIVSLFVDHPVKTMKFELLASKKEYFNFKKWVNSIAANTIEMLNLEKVLSLIKLSWEKGDYLTDKTSIDGEDWIYPNRIHYTKPIVMLIDELSGSGGDAFPSLMGGIGRATLLGTRTAGLGGHINQAPPLNNSGMEIYITKSLFYRPDGVAVENNGAVPDVHYSTTRDDFLYGYKNYQKFYLNVLFDQIK